MVVAAVSLHCPLLGAWIDSRRAGRDFERDVAGSAGRFPEGSKCVDLHIVESKEGLERLAVHFCVFPGAVCRIPSSRTTTGI